MPALSPDEPHVWTVNVTCPRCRIPGDSTPISFPCCEHVSELRAQVARLREVLGRLVDDAEHCILERERMHLNDTALVEARAVLASGKDRLAVTP